ncbi:unnamed protein product [Cylindrotheca closterium]|uniref:Bulb-type lectin domain-containing protein n=1 Tax=Cylindrotheca closterium TaxID=2856 RepID=A0AAD2FNJ9_9STRA|nr:unnamed protein product [Cylindrotheca closterium]
MKNPPIHYLAILVLLLGGGPYSSYASDDKHKPKTIKGAESSQQESERQLFFEDGDEGPVRKDIPLVSKDDMRLPFFSEWRDRVNPPSESAPVTVGVSNIPSESPSSLPSAATGAVSNVPSESPSSLPSDAPTDSPSSQPSNASSVSNVPTGAPSPSPPTAEPTRTADRPLKCVQSRNGSGLTIEHSTRFYAGDVHCLSRNNQEAYFGYTWTNQFGLFVNGQSVWEIPQKDLGASVFRWTFQRDGNLVLRSQNDQVVWTSASCCSSDSQLRVSMERVWIESRSGSQPFYMTPPPTQPPPPTRPPTRRPTSRPQPNPTPRPNPVSNPPPRDSAVSYVPGKLTRNQNGLLLSRGLRSRIIARTNDRVRLANGSNSRDRFHGEPDGAAVFPDSNGGWIYVSNSEENGGRGGVGAIYFNRNGDVVDYKMLLRGTTRNCSGGKTPWNTWVSCEEHRGGKIWQVDPKGKRSPQKTSMSPDTGDFEAFAYDVRNRSKPRFFVTEDNNRGALRRFTPSNPNWNDPWNMLHGSGALDYLVLQPRNGNKNDGTYYWTRDRGHAEGNAESFYHFSEGLDVHNNELYFTSKTLKSLFVLNLDGDTYRRFSTDRGLFDGQPDQMQRLIKGSNSLLYFCEDGGKEAGIHARDRNGWFYTILEAAMDNRETSGLAFSPDGKHMYFSYQMRGIIFDVWREDGLPFYGKTLDVHYHEK